MTTDPQPPAPRPHRRRTAIALLGFFALAALYVYWRAPSALERLLDPASYVKRAVAAGSLIGDSPEDVRLFLGTPDFEGRERWIYRLKRSVFIDDLGLLVRFDADRRVAAALLIDVPKVEHGWDEYVEELRRTEGRSLAGDHR